MAEVSLWEQLLEVNRDYFGPAAERFLDRQIDTHIGKSPQKITKRDLAVLNDWLRLSFALLTNDSELVDHYAQRLALIARGQGKEALSPKWTIK